MPKTPMKTTSESKQKSKKVFKPKQEAIILREPEVVKAKGSEEKKSNEPTKVSTIISIVSLIVVLLNIITTTIFGFQQQKGQQAFQATQQVRDQEFQAESQKQFFDIQNQNQLANIEIAVKDVTDSLAENAITIRNLGPTTAKNLTIIVCIQEISFTWLEQISGIENFSITLPDPALIHTQENRIDNCNHTIGIDKPNATQIGVDTLTRNEEINIDISRPVDTQIDDHETNVSAFIIFNKYEFPHDRLANLVIDQQHINQAIEKIINEEFSIARLWVSVRCENCPNANQYVTVSGIGFSKVSKIEVTENTSNYSIVHADVSVSFLQLPNGQIMKDLVFYLEGYGENLTFSKIEKVEFEATPKRQCNDGLDNDFDGYVDYPNDPECNNPYDDDEGN